MPGLPVCHHPLKFAHVHVHCLGDSIQPSHPLTTLFCSQCFPASGIFYNELAVCITCPRYWSSDTNSLKGHLVKCRHNIHNCLGNQTICVTCFVTPFALLWWFGTEPAIYLRYACTQDDHLQVLFSIQHNTIQLSPLCFLTMMIFLSFYNNTFLIFV